MSDNFRDQQVKISVDPSLSLEQKIERIARNSKSHSKQIREKLKNILKK
jgi:hypothetical protein